MNDAPTSNVIDLRLSLARRTEANAPVLEASGVSQHAFLPDTWELSKMLINMADCLHMSVVEMEKEAERSKSIALLRAAAYLERHRKEMRLSAARASKLERKLAKAKRKAKRRA